MLSQSAEIEYANLGEYLRETRISLGIDLVTVAEKTKISPKNLQAIEDNDFATLPAEAFTRGFCALYAKILSLDPQLVLEMYAQERPNQRNSKNGPIRPPRKQTKDVGSMAERPSFMPFSFFGLILLALLLFGGFLSWYFSWNPATYLSQKLRSLEHPQRIEQVSANRTDPDIWEASVRFAPIQKTRLRRLDLFNLSYPSTATAAIAQDMPKVPTQLPEQPLQ
ncbi:MAG: hypothetical protein GQ542_12365 [Desulforhopalus sp.]|nr:hypothetical protein [Desulforhopalus sp.]